MVGEDVEPESQPARRIVADRRAFTGFRDGEEMPLICPTCQLALKASLPAACYFAWGCFRYFGSAHLRRGFFQTSPAVMPAKARCDTHGSESSARRDGLSPELCLVLPRKDGSPYFLF